MPQVQGSTTKYLVRAGWSDVPHLTEKAKAELLAAYQPHMRAARTRGEPVLGSGLIFPIDEALITCAPAPIPKHWARLASLDFGWEHSTAVTWLAHDRDPDTVYVYDVHRAALTLIPVHAAAINTRPGGKWIPVAWPHDGYQVKDAMHGEQLAQQYRDHGVLMREEHAHFEETPVVAEQERSTISTEAGIQAILTRMTLGKFKVFAHLEPWFEEFRMYHRKEGLIVKERDDLMSATRIGIMDLRHAITEPAAGRGIDHNRRSDGLYS